ncbi:hypothetical protein BW716_34335 [[Flexibacter] sp. ATCC 35208]|nr:hypothetical protein BW716_34335 [[Flexibacter] sp. ATCC 35208]
MFHLAKGFEIGTSHTSSLPFFYFGISWKALLFIYIYFPQRSCGKLTGLLNDGIYNKLFAISA